MDLILITMIFVTFVFQICLAVKIRELIKTIDTKTNENTKAISDLLVKTNMLGAAQSITNTSILTIISEVEELKKNGLRNYLN